MRRNGIAARGRALGGDMGTGHGRLPAPVEEAAARRAGHVCCDSAVNNGRVCGALRVARPGHRAEAAGAAANVVQGKAVAAAIVAGVHCAGGVGVHSGGHGRGRNARRARAHDADLANTVGGRTGGTTMDVTGAWFDFGTQSCTSTAVARH